MLNETTTGLDQARDKWNMGNLPPEGHEYVGKFAWGLFDEAKREKVDRLGMHDRWLEHHRKWRGQRQGKKYSPTVMNTYFKTIHGHVAAMTEKTPRSEVNSDDAPQSQVTALNGEIDNWWNETEGQHSLFASVLNSSLYGTTTEKPRFDADKNEACIDITDPFGVFPAPGYTMCNTKDLPYLCFAYFIPVWKIKQLYDVPGDKQIRADAEEVLLGKERESVYGGSKVKGGQQPNLPSNFAETQRGDWRNQRDEALVVEVWCRDNAVDVEQIMGEVQAAFSDGSPAVDDFGQPVTQQGVVGTRQTPRYPDGIRVITVCNNGDIVLDDAKNPNINWDLLEERVEFLVTTGMPTTVPVTDQMGNPVVDPATGQPLLQQINVPMPEEEAREKATELARKTHAWGRFPLIAIPSYEDTAQWWGFSIIEQMEALQTKAENLLTKMTAYYERCMFPTLILPKGCGVKKSEINNRLGLVIEPSVQTSQFIRYLDPPNLPSGIDNLLEYLFQLQDNVTMRPEVQQGIRPQGVSAASAIIALQDKAATLAQPQIRNVDKLIRERGRWYISMQQNFGNEEKPVNVDGETLTLLGVHLMGGFDFEVESGSSAPITKMGRRQQYVELFKLGAMDMESLLEMLEIPNPPRIMERLAEERGLTSALDVLIKAGLPIEMAQQIQTFLMQDQTPDTGTQQGEAEAEGSQPTGPPAGSGEMMEASYQQMQG
jgi:hypothetical protein